MIALCRNQKLNRLLFVVCFGLLAVLGCSEDRPFEQEILDFEAADRTEQLPTDAIVFVGSSSIRLWTTLAEDVAPVPIIRRGFGGASLGDCIHYVDRVVTKYDPKAVFVFCGSNDIAGEEPKTAEAVLELYKEFVGRIHAKLPATPVYFISISPTRSRWNNVAIVREANELIEAWSATSEHLYYIDTASALLDEAGEPKDELFREDQLHLSSAGYEVWTEIIRPIVHEAYDGSE